MEEDWTACFRNYTRVSVNFFILPVLVLVGALGNSITVYILLRKKLCFSSTIYLTALSISDLFFLLSSFSVSWSYYDWFKTVERYWLYLPIGLWISNATRFTSIWLAVSFTVERYIAVCHPMSRKFSYFDNRASIISTGVYIICFFWCAPSLLEWEPVMLHSSQKDGKNNTIFSLEYANLGRHFDYRLIYHCITISVFVLLPFIILVTGNLFLIRAVLSSQKARQDLISSHVRRRQAQNTTHQENRIIITLVIVILLFLICQLPSAALSIYSCIRTPFIKTDSPEENIVAGLGHVFNLLVALSSVSNFILYTASSTNYRQSFENLFCFNRLSQIFEEAKSANIFVVVPRSHPVNNCVGPSRIASAIQNGDGFKVNKSLKDVSVVTDFERRFTSWPEFQTTSTTDGVSTKRYSEPVTV